MSLIVCQAEFLRLTLETDCSRYLLRPGGYEPAGNPSTSLTDQGLALIAVTFQVPRAGTHL
jgi:hypothetical protein